jgi:hypothetical protein
MKALSCEQAGLLLDLFAAGECDPADEKAVRTHLGACPTCRQTVEESRQMLGLLDLTFRSDAALARLSHALRSQTKPQRRPPLVHPFIQPLGAVAALLLVAFGLVIGLAPVFRSESRDQPVLQLALVTGGPAPPDAVRDKKALADAAKIVTLEARNKAVLEKQLASAVTADRWPLPPRVHLELVLHNPGRTPLEVQLGGPGFALELELSTATVIRRTSPKPAFVPFPERTLTIAPGDSARLPIERLASQTGNRVEYLYPTEPGKYALRVRLSTVATHPDRPSSRRAITLTAGPVKVAVHPPR